MGPKKTNLALDALRLHPIVGIEPRNHLSSDLPDPAIESGGKAKLGLTDDADAFVPARVFIQHTPRVISRAVIDYHKLKIAEGLRKHALNGLAEPSCPVAHRHNDRDLWRHCNVTRARTCCQHPRIDNILLERCAAPVQAHLLLLAIFGSMTVKGCKKISSSSVPA